MYTVSRLSNYIFTALVRPIAPRPIPHGRQVDNEISENAIACLIAVYHRPERW